MHEPTLNYVVCPGAARARDASTVAPQAPTHRMAYWEWNRTGDAQCPRVVVCVHGLTRQGRDFDVLAQHLSQHARVICPDVVGRGYSDWLQDPMAYTVPNYAVDMLSLLAQVHQQAPVAQLDWVGTSMGGLIGMCVAALPELPQGGRIRRLVLNDVGPRLEWAALQRIGSYVGQAPVFASEQAGADALRVLAAGFGPHTDAQWLALSRPMLRPLPDASGWQLHYDPALAQPMQGMTAEQAAQSEALLWSVYDTISAQTLLIRGAQSDLLSTKTVHEMAQRGPKARSVEVAGVGHAPTLIDPAQVQLVQEFLFE